MFLGIYDADKKRRVEVKLNDAIKRYIEKFGSEPTLCLTNHQEAMELANAGWHGVDVPDVEIRSVGYVPRHTFYIGVPDEVASDAA